jgi:hypothetical protein
MLPPYLARIEDLGRDGGLRRLPPLKLLTPEALKKLGLSLGGEGSRPQRAVPVPRMRREGPGGRFDQVAARGRSTAVATDKDAR